MKSKTRWVSVKPTNWLKSKNPEVAPAEDWEEMYLLGGYGLPIHFAVLTDDEGGSIVYEFGKDQIVGPWYASPQLAKQSADRVRWRRDFWGVLPQVMSFLLLWLGVIAYVAIVIAMLRHVERYCPDCDQIHLRWHEHFQGAAP